MQLLVIHGSPRREGNTDLMGAALAAGAKEAGYHTERIYTAGLTIKSCIDCRKCWAGGRVCVQRDDMEALYPLIEKADVIAFAVPVYFFSWIGPVKSLIDRLLPLIPRSERNLVGKKAILLSAAGDTDDDVFDGLLISYKAIVKYMKMTDLGAILAGGVYEKGEITKGDWLQQAEALGKSLAKAR